MFEVYLNVKHDRLLVIAKGHQIPFIENSGRWRKKKGAVAVSEEIRLALQKDGFYWRRLAGHRESNAQPRYSGKARPKPDRLVPRRERDGRMCVI